MRFILTLLCTLSILAGCQGVRLTIDAVPADDELEQTEVMSDRPAGDMLDRIVLIDVTGPITRRRSNVLGTTARPVSDFSEALRKAERDGRVRAVIVRIDSPGGGVAASDQMYRDLVRFRERTGRPVVALMGDIAASGGLYIACGADRIVAHPTTVTGSIGVIMQTVDVSEGLARIGIRTDAIVSGPNKAMGSPFETMTEEQRALFQGIVDEFYASFVSTVRAARPALSEDDIGWVTDGRVVTGRRAGEIGLVDMVGDLDDAFAEAKRMAGIERARLVRYHRPDERVGSPQVESPAPQVNLLQLNLPLAPQLTQPGFYYLWDPRAWAGGSS